MKRKHIRLAVLGSSVAASIAFAVPASQAATVPNMFYRTCTIGCSAYVQSNGPYQPSVISECITKGYFGRVTSSYEKWGRC